MQYPIFNSFINRIKSDLLKKNIEPKEFTIWTEDTINATGLELKIDLSGVSNYVKDVTINFDWDKFREVACARQLSGMDKHPLLNSKQLNVKKELNPNMDVEVTWNLNQNAILNDYSNEGSAWRIDLATQWMDSMNKNITESLPADYIISRWHIEVDGDEEGRYLSAMSLISYFQFTLSQLDSLNEILEFISKRLQLILIRSNRVIQIAENTAKIIAA
jgi:hypothetical protein